MKFIEGISREQTSVFPIFLDASIEKYNEVRFIDIFIDTLELNTRGFKMDLIENGCPDHNTTSNLS